MLVELANSYWGVSVDKKKAYSQLAYQLIYPGVLGSMVFDLADPFRDFTVTWFCSLLIACCFVIDYLHMTLNLCQDGTAPHKFGPVLDIVIAILFCLSYFSLSRITVPDFHSEQTLYYVGLCLGFLWMAHALIMIYEMPIKGMPSLLDSTPICLSSMGVGILFWAGSAENAVNIAFVTSLIILVTYTLRVFKYDSIQSKGIAS